MTSLLENTDWLKTFSDRVDAGRKLGLSLRRYIIENPIVVALPRGGVPIALEVSRELHAPMEILLVCKIEHPQHPDQELGAVGEDGESWISPVAIEKWQLRLGELNPLIETQGAEVKRQREMFRGQRKPLSVFGRTVILVDDGLSPGACARVAASHLRKRGAHRIILALPVCAKETSEAVGTWADEIFCLEEAANIHSVNCFYGDLHSLTDDEVSAALHLAWDSGAWDYRRYVMQRN